MIVVQGCNRCCTLQYPARDVCRNCLSDDLSPREVASGGTLLATALVHRSLAPEFSNQLPLAIGKVQLDCGIHVICYVAAGLDAGDAIRLESEERNAEKPIWVARRWAKSEF